ncbi:hypothetical protein CRYUN_Cryun41cG0053500 [Craigia yunnanensis]
MMFTKLLVLITADNAINQDEQTCPQPRKAFDMNYFNKNNLVSTLSNTNESSLSPLHQRTTWNICCDKDLQMQNSSNLLPKAIDSIPLASSVPSHVHKEDYQALPFSDPRQCTANSVLFNQSNKPVMSIDQEDLYIPSSELVLKEKIGAGAFGSVHCAELCGCEVAVKILMEQGFHTERFREFLREVAIMKRLWHPNIVLFMGAVTQPPKLSIVTEYLSRGSLFRFLQMPDAGLVLDERRRLNMALDVVMCLRQVILLILTNRISQEFLFAIFEITSYFYCMLRHLFLVRGKGNELSSSA